jgi:hypothetical protein
LGYAGGGPSRKSFSLRNIFSAGNNGLDLAGFTPVSQLTPFTPLSIPGAILWLDAADTSTITSNVATGLTAWADKSGNGYNAAPGLFTIPGCVVWITPAVQGLTGAVTTQLYNFGTAGGFFTTTTASGSVTATLVTYPTLTRLDLSAGANITVPSVTYTQTTRTVIGVVALGASSPSNYYVINDALDAIGVQGFYTSGSALWFSKLSVTQLTTNNNPPNVFGSTSMICATNNGGGGVFVNGSSQPLVTQNNTGFTAGTTTAQVLGGGNSGAFSIYELMVFDGALTTSQQQQMEGYLAWKYGLQTSLPPSHPYYTTPFRNTFTATYTPPLIRSTTLNKLNAIATNSEPITIPTFGWTTWHTIFAVVYTPTNFSYFAGSPTSSYVGYFETNNYGLYYTSPAGGASDANYSPGTQVIPLNQWNIMSIGYGGGSQVTNYAVNGTVRSATYSVTLSPTANQTNFAPLYLNSWGPTQINGTDNNIIAEILHFNRSLTNNERQTIEGYLAQKWGLQALLPPAHPYRYRSV